MVFPTVFNLSLNFAIWCSWSEPQSAPGLVFADCLELLHLWLERMKSIWFHYWPSCDVHVYTFSCVVERGCLLWPVCSLGKTLLAFALLHFVLQGQTCLLPQVSLDFLLLHSSSLWWKGQIVWCLLVLEGLTGPHRTIQLWFLQCEWLGHRPGLLWLNGLPWKPQRSFCQFWDCTQILHFKLFSWL